MFIFTLPVRAEEKSATSGHYLFAWAGDDAQKGDDFRAVIDADPNSADYGHLVTTAVTDQKSMQVHHTEYTMPEGGLLFANDHLAGRTFIFDLRDSLSPKIDRVERGNFTREPSQIPYETLSRHTARAGGAKAVALLCVPRAHPVSS